MKEIMGISAGEKAFNSGFAAANRIGRIMESALQHQLAVSQEVVTAYLAQCVTMQQLLSSGMCLKSGHPIVNVEDHSDSEIIRYRVQFADQSHQVFEFCQETIDNTPQRIQKYRYRDQYGQSHFPIPMEESVGDVPEEVMALCDVWSTAEDRKLTFTGEGLALAVLTARNIGTVLLRGDDGTLGQFENPNNEDGSLSRKVSLSVETVLARYQVVPTEDN